MTNDIIHHKLLDTYDKIIIMEINQLYTKKVLAGKGKTKHFYRLQTAWNNNSFKITILEDCNSFKAEVSEKTLRELSIKYEKEFDEYLKEIQESLCGGDSENFKYCVKANTFAVSRVKDNITFEIANFPVVHTDFNATVLEFIDEEIQVNDNLNSQLSELNKKIIHAVDDRNLYAEKLENYVELKRCTENALYAKFATLLNEKKIRIQYLTEMLKSNKSASHPIDSSIMDEEVQSRISIRSEVISDSDTDDEIKANAVEIVTPEKTLSSFFNDEDDLKDINVLPKRAKINPEVKPNTENENINEESNIPTDTKNNSSQPITEDDSQNESLHFNTQDLFDRI